jgi:DNA-binding CsgD family transcriptional regulator
LDAAFEQALSQRDALGPFEHGRTELLYGTRLVDAGRLEEGSRILLAALEAFERLGADPWADRARTGIVAAGGTVPERQGMRTERLSPRELEVGLAAARGASAAEIAELLFLGPRTVQLALASAAIKLGVASQDELVEALTQESGVPAA